MIGVNKDTEFDIENYEEFYSHHRFVPTNDEHAFNIHEIIPRFGWGFSKIEELEPTTLLDIGCLDGSFALTIAKHFNIPVVGVDLTEDGIRMARERAEQEDLAAEFYQGSAEEVLTRFADEGRKFDMVAMFEIIEHVKDVPLFLKCIDDVLAPGGNVLMSTPVYESELYGADDEKNKCHIRLYTLEKEDYSRPNKYGTLRTATSLWKEIGEDRLKEAVVRNHLINARYQ